VIAHPQSLTRLRDAGHARAMQWIEQHARQVGRRDSIDLVGLFGGDAGAPPRHRGERDIGA